MHELTKISELSARYDVSARTLRYYEEMGLLCSTRSEEYAYRMYDGEALKRLEQILILRKLNIPIKDIRRIFDAAGSEVVLEVLGKKVANIDDEVALLSELKSIVLDFIEQIKAADFASGDDIKRLYEKATEIETRLVHADYDGNAANVHRLLEVTEQLASKADIVRKTRFYQIWNVSDAEAASEFYLRVFGEEKAIRTTPAGDHSGIEINGYFILLITVADPAEIDGGCAVSFASEAELLAAYHALKEGCKHCALDENPGWTSLCAWVRDKYDVSWFFCV
ncbi:MAG: MerR family transcriptional regulator [Oscillospiraceae bacterium]|jgi:DNA-binding transcriptional MerR regulator/predicted 3-demethylubiquinone-9 3-methyltransferase (glyoxalase superfamily)|nr:MerR family transcriptional regulator [Oscillospiraceae bacterium]